MMSRFLCVLFIGVVVGIRDTTTFCSSFVVVPHHHHRHARRGHRSSLPSSYRYRNHNHNHNRQWSSSRLNHHNDQLESRSQELQAQGQEGPLLVKDDNHNTSNDEVLDNENTPPPPTTTTTTTSIPTTIDSSSGGNGNGDGDGFNAVVLLNIVAIIWGTQHSIIKTVVEDCDASSFSLARFGIATVIASPYTPSIGPFLTRLFDIDADTNTNTNANTNTARIEDGTTSGCSDSDGSNSSIVRGEEDDDDDSKDAAFMAWKWGIEMGMWMFLGYAFQAVGLEYTTASRSGFLLYLNVKFVPFFARILFGRTISVSTWGSALAAVVGTALIAYDGGKTMIVWNVGDLLSIAAAAASAMFILRLESASNAVRDSSALNATSLWVVTLASLVWCILEGIIPTSTTTNPLLLLMENGSSYLVSSNQEGAGLWTVMTNSLEATSNGVIQTLMKHPVELLYLGGITTALANYIQTKAQGQISAERASIIYALDPVYGTFDVFFLKCHLCACVCMCTCVHVYMCTCFIQTSMAHHHDDTFSHGCHILQLFHNYY
jgi:drug/metabolite transporter (DMT)-like permease